MSKNNTLQNIAEVTPLQYLIPSNGNYTAIAKELLVFLALKNYSDYKSDEPKTQTDIADAIRIMTNGTRTIKQSTVSKAISKIQTHKVLMQNTLFTIEKNWDDVYEIVPFDEELEQLIDFLTPDKIFMNNPNGISTLFALKVDLENVEIVKSWILRSYARDIFETLEIKDMLVVLLKTSSNTYAQTSKSLRKALLSELNNTNHILRNIAVSWKKR